MVVIAHVAGVPVEEMLPVLLSVLLAIVATLRAKLEGGRRNWPRLRRPPRA